MQRGESHSGRLNVILLKLLLLSSIEDQKKKINLIKNRGVSFP